MELIRCKKVILCAGGSSYPATGSDGDGIRLAAKTGHMVTPVFPALVPLESSHPAITSLQGLSLKNVKAALWLDGRKKYEEFGEMLFVITSYSIHYTKLYDEADPSEERDLAAAEPERVERMAAALAARLAELGAVLPRER